LRDVQSIEEHATFLAKVQLFLLDATLGLVTIEQNDIIKPDLNSVCGLG
jgi:magnesium transporter